MKKLFAVLVAFAAISMPFAVYAETSDFIINDGCVEKYTGTDENVVIPSVSDGAAVTSIGSSCFSGNESIKSIFIPASIEEIWQDNLADYGSYPFLYMPKLESIEVDAENSYFTSDNGVLIDKMTSTLLYYPENKADEVYYVSDNVQAVRSLAFNKCNNLKELYITNNDTSFGAMSIGYGNSFTIYCYVGSSAELYAGNDFAVKYIVNTGDANADGFITANDCTFILSKALDGGFEIKVNEKALDINGDGKITADDAALLLSNILD